MNRKVMLRIMILLVVLAAAGWAGYRYGLPALRNFQAARQEPTAAAPFAFQTARVRLDGGQAAAAVTTGGAVRSKQSTVLAWQTSGTVSRVNAAAGQPVAAGDVLAELEPASLPQAVILARAELVAAQKALDTLLQSTQARAAAQMALVKAQQALEDAQDDRRSKLYQRASPETIDIARAHLIEANEALDQAEAFFDGHSGDTESLTYAAALSRLARARQEQIRAEYNLRYVEGLPEPLDIEEADARIAVAEAAVLQARLDWERVKDGPNPDDVAAAEARVTAAQATLNLARIRAPFGGTLTLVDCQAGDQVVPGVLAFQLDDLSHLYLDVAVIEDEIERVQAGQPAAIRFDALPGREYPGRVTEIGAFGRPTAGTVNFTVTVEILAPGAEIRPGMTASVTLITGAQAGGLLVPAQALAALDGQAVVYLLQDGLPVPVAVETGPQSGADALITAGALQAGDLVVLNPPATARGATPVPLPARPAAPTPAATEEAPTPAKTEASAANAVAAAASAAALEYADALEKGDYQAAAALYSDFSLMLSGMTRAEAALALQGELARGIRRADFAVKDARALDDRTVLVRVAYTLESAETAQQVDEWWPLRLENGRWRYNRENLIDFRALDVPEQAAGGLVVKPLRLARYSDRIRLSLMVQNTTNEAIVLGQANEILARFTFAGQVVEGVHKQMIFDRLRTNPEVVIEVLGLYTTYPDGVIIRQWKNYNVAPWFTFSFTE